MHVRGAEHPPSDIYAHAVPERRGLSGGLVSPNGSEAAFNTCQVGSCVVTVADIDGTDVRTLTVPEGLFITGPWWSPDGTKLLHALADGSVEHAVGNLFVHDLATDRRIRITDLDLEEAYWFELSFDFSPDGERVIFHLPRTTEVVAAWEVWSVPITGGEPTLVLRNAAFLPYFPDGEQIAFVVPEGSAFDGRRIAIADADGSRRTLARAKRGGLSVALDLSRRSDGCLPGR